jgi:hypothetical protein
VPWSVGFLNEFESGEILGIDRAEGLPIGIRDHEIVYAVLF